MKHQLLMIAFAALVAACVPAPGYQPGPAYPSAAEAAASPTAPATYGTDIYINGEQLTIQQEAQLEQLLGEAVPPGRYALDAQYNFGYEGQAPVVNLAAYARQRQAQAAATSGNTESSETTPGKPFSMYSRDSSGAGSSLVSDGNGCMIMSTPSGSLSSGC